MALGLLANLNSLEVRKSTVSPASIMTASFAKTVDSPAPSLIHEGSDPAKAAPSRAQMRSYLIAERNVLGAISMASTAHDALAELGNLLERMRNLVSTAAGTALPSDTLRAMRDEYGRVQAAIDSLRTETTYNGTELLGPNAQPVTLDLGPIGETGDPLQLTFSHFAWASPDPSVVGSTDPGVSEQALASIDGAIATSVTQRAELRSAMKRIQTTAESVETRRLNTAATHARVRDVAVAEEMARLSSDLVLRQPGVSILAQSEQLPQLSLGLLR